MQSPISPTVTFAVPPGMRTTEPPDDGRQILAWAIDQHGKGHGRPSDYPRWCIVQFVSDLPECAPYWRWSFPGCVTEVHILGWLPLPMNDHWGVFALDAAKQLAETT